MKNSIFLFLFNLVFIASFAQPQTYGYQPPESESGCYAQCVLPGDTIKTTEVCEVKPKWVVPSVNPGYPLQETITYPVVEACTTCEVYTAIGDKFKEEIVMIEPGYCEYVTIPCVWVEVTDSVLIQEESWAYEPVAPDFGTDTVTVTLEGEDKLVECIPAVRGREERQIEIEEACETVDVREYEWQTETHWVVTSPAYTTWVKRSPGPGCVTEDCMIWCKETVPEVKEACEAQVKKGCPYGYEDNGEFCIRKTPTPPKYKTVTVETCEQPADFKETFVKRVASETVDIKTLVKDGDYVKRLKPAVYDYFTRRVLKEPARVEKICHQPKFDTIRLGLATRWQSPSFTDTPGAVESCTKILCTPPEITTVTHGPIINTIIKTEIRNANLTEWKEVLCPADINSYTIGQIQEALYKEGYDCGPIDNVYGTKTINALTQFQKDKNLPIGQLDFKTLKALNVKF